MVSQMRMSTERIENLIVEKIETRLSKVVWGFNCSEVRDALKFDEELFVADVMADDDKNAIEEFLLQEGFQPKMSRINGVVRNEWFFPVTPKSIRFAELRKNFERYCQEITSIVEVQADEIVKEFAESTLECKVIWTNSVQYKAAEKAVGRYNQETFVFNNRRNANYQRPFIKYFYHNDYPLLALTKQNEVGDCLERATQAFLKAFWEDFFGVLSFGNSAIRYSNISSGKICMCIDGIFAKQYKSFFESVGIKASFFPKYAESEYFDILNMPKDNVHIPIYLEVGNLVERDLFPNQNDRLMVAINKEYRNFCRLMNIKVRK